MFPIGDDNTDRTITPIVNYIFIGINILVFVLLQGLGGNDAFSYAFSLVPKEVMTGIDITGVQVAAIQWATQARSNIMRHRYPSTSIF